MTSDKDPLKAKHIKMKNYGSNTNSESFEENPKSAAHSSSSLNVESKENSKLPSQQSLPVNLGASEARYRAGPRRQSTLLELANRAAANQALSPNTAEAKSGSDMFKQKLRVNLISDKAIRTVLETFTEKEKNAKFKEIVWKVMDKLREEKNQKLMSEGKCDEIPIEDFNFWQRMIHVNLMGSKLFEYCAIFNFEEAALHHASQTDYFNLDSIKMNQFKSIIISADSAAECKALAEGNNKGFQFGTACFAFHHKNETSDGMDTFSHSVVLEEIYMPTEYADIDKDHPIRISLVAGQSNVILGVHHHSDQAEVDTLMLATFQQCDLVNSGF